MQTNIHLSGKHEEMLSATYAPFKAEGGDDDYDALEINDGFGGRIVVFVQTYDQAQQLVEAAVQLRSNMRAKLHAKPVKCVKVRRDDPDEPGVIGHTAPGKCLSCGAEKLEFSVRAS